MALQERGSQFNTRLMPDIQNADSLTQSQDLPSQQATSSGRVVWGKLWSLRASVKHFEIMKDSFTFGRIEDCDVCLTKDDTYKNLLNTISRIHFRIYRERVKDTNETLVYLEDTSRNGTFVDRVKVGHGNRVILENNSKIAIFTKNISIYIFTNVLINDLPLELKMKYALGCKLTFDGKVRMIFTKNSSQRFAMKTVKKDFGTNKSLFNQQIKNEVQILKKLKHSCLIKMEDIYDTPTTMYIIFELMEGGNLFDRIKSRGKLTESCAKLIFYQVVLAVNYLHKNDIIHRDLKPENILLKSDSDKTLVKVSNFGLSKLIDYRSMTIYNAPEILETLGRDSYAKQVDIWSLGMILHTCLCGIIRCNVQTKDISLDEHSTEKIKRGLHSLSSQYLHLSPYAIDMIKHMMIINPAKRVNVSQILLHPWWLRDRSMREEVHKLMETSIRNEQIIIYENRPPSNNFERNYEDVLCREFKRMRLNE